MLPKENRANSAEIILASEEGKFYSSWLFACLLYSLDDSRPSHFAFIVSTKINKRAVRRNRVKRLMRVAIGDLLERIKQGKIIVFLAKREILDKDLAVIKKEIERILMRAGVLGLKG